MSDLNSLRTSIRLRFVVDDDTKSTASCYELQWRVAESAEWQTASAELGGPTCTKGGLKPGESYEFRARVLTVVADVPEWSEFSAPTAPIRTPETAGSTNVPASVPPPAPLASLRSSLSQLTDAEIVLSAHYTRQTMHELPQLGASPLLLGEAAADSSTRTAAGVPTPTQRHAKDGSWTKPTAVLRLVVMYGMGGFSISMREWWREAPPWLEVRCLEVPGHGFLSEQPLPLMAGSPTEMQPDPPTELAHIATARDKLIRAFVDELEPLLRGGKTALFGFSNGAMVAYLITVELQRRRVAAAASTSLAATPVELPLHLFVAGRAAAHRLASATAEQVLEQTQMSDEQMVAWATRIGVLAPGQRPVNGAHFAALCRSDYPIGVLEAGTRPPGDPGSAVPAANERFDEGRFTSDAQQVACPLTAILSDGDQMWPCDVHQKHWGALAAGTFTPVKVRGVPHEKLSVAPEARHAVFAALALAAKRMHEVAGQHKVKEDRG